MIPSRQQILTDYEQRIIDNQRIKLTTEERSFLVQDFIDQLQSLENAEAIKQLCQTEIELLERGYGRGTNSTINYLSKYRTAIAQATKAGKLPMTEETSYQFNGHKQRTGEPIQALNHIAFGLMRYDNSIYLANRKQTNVGNNERQDHPQPFDPDLYLNKAISLLQADEPETLAIGIVAVTGRRHTEVAVSGQFELTKHPYVLSFDGQLKKEAPVAYSIATLLPAERVMQAIKRFRAMPQVQELAGLTSEDQHVKNFRARVNTRVKQQFQRTGILPLLTGFQSVSIHRLRGAYARMIVHYWLPNQGANEQRFLQFYLGHVEPGEMRDAFNSGSTTHYFGYRLEKDGKPITASGIKLMSNPPLPNPTQQQITQQQQANERLETLETTDGNELDELSTPDTQEIEMLSLTTIETIAQSLEDLPSKVTELGQSATPKSKSTRTRVSKPRFKDLAVNVSDLTIAAQHLGLELPKNKGYQSLLQQVFQTILEQEAKRSTIQSEALMQAISPLVQKLDQFEARLQDVQTGGEPLRLLNNEVEALSQQLQTIQAERDQFEAECESLRTQLQQSQDVINQFRLIALGAVAISPAGNDEVSGSVRSTSAKTVVTSPQSAASVQGQSASAPQAVNHPPAQSSTRQKRDRKPDSSGKRSVRDRLKLAVEAIMQYNADHSEAKQRWQISNQLLADLVGTNNYTVVKPWIEECPEIAERIRQHNDAMGTTAQHHNRGRDGEKQELKTFVQALIGQISLNGEGE